MKKIPVGRFAAFATVTALVLIASSFALMSVAEGPEAEIEFDLNGGTLNGQGTFFRTESSLVTGLPDISDTVMPAGKDEFVVWSASPTSYSQIYNIGDPVPSGITTFYAIWGVNLDVSANMTVSAAGCYIVNGGSAPLRDVD
ncbi:MAG: hypothetical protein GX137_05950, partial [Thermoplasmatales archaeon]|nr:hypothetical protein [Thermoplasmatales archaeon]